jgi:hypothetical protein
VPQVEQPDSQLVHGMAHVVHGASAAHVEQAEQVGQAGAAYEQVVHAGAAITGAKDTGRYTVLGT